MLVVTLVLGLAGCAGVQSERVGDRMLVTQAAKQCDGGRCVVVAKAYYNPPMDNLTASMDAEDSLRQAARARAIRECGGQGHSLTSREPSYYDGPEHMMTVDVMYSCVGR